MKVRTLVNVWIQQPGSSLPPHLTDFVQLCREMVPEISFYEAPWNQDKPNQVMATAVEYLQLSWLLQQIKNALIAAGGDKAVMRRFGQLCDCVDPPGKPLPGGFGQIGRYRTGTIVWTPRAVEVEGQHLPYDLIGTVPPGAPHGKYATAATHLPRVVAWRVGDLGAPFSSVPGWVQGMRAAEKLLEETDFEEYLQKDYWNYRAGLLGDRYPRQSPVKFFTSVLQRLAEAHQKQVDAVGRSALLESVRWLYSAWRGFHAAGRPPGVGGRNKARWDFAALAQTRSQKRAPGQSATEQAFQGLIHELRTQRRRWQFNRWVERLRPAEEAEARWASQAFASESEVQAVDDSIYLLTHIPMPGPACGPVWFELVKKYPEIVDL